VTGVAAFLVVPRALAQDSVETRDGLYLPPPGVSSRNDLYLPGSATPGQPATPSLLDDLDAMFGVEEGRGAARIRILFEFGCPRSPELYARVRPMLALARFDWIPVPAQNAPADAPAAALFAPGASAETLRDVFNGRKPPAVDPEPARNQGRLFARKIGPELYRETNRPFATPTMAYRGRDAEARIIRGAPDLGTLRTIIASAR
jgi:hypothetical protein